jgi:phosphoribosylglycinamide formyltransferase-1
MPQSARDKRVPTDKLRLAVFVSGGGTNLQAILDACADPNYPAEVAVVVSNVPEAYALTRAKRAAVPGVAVSHRTYRMRSDHESEIIRQIEPYRVELLVLAGYMRVLTPLLLNHFYDHEHGLPGVINIHPADTHLYQGAHGYEFALGLLPEHPRRLSQTAITVHFVDHGVDTGPIIRQAPLEVLPDDTLESLRARGLILEHQLYPEVIRLYAEGRIECIGREVRIRDGQHR